VVGVPVGVEAGRDLADAGTVKLVFDLLRRVDEHVRAVDEDFAGYAPETIRELLAAFGRDPAGVRG
jgi:hypothetical protein